MPVRWRAVVGSCDESIWCQLDGLLSPRWLFAVRLVPTEFFISFFLQKHIQWPFIGNLALKGIRNDQTWRRDEGMTPVSVFFCFIRICDMLCLSHDIFLVCWKGWVWLFFFISAFIRICLCYFLTYNQGERVRVRMSDKERVARLLCHYQQWGDWCKKVHGGSDICANQAWTFAVMTGWSVGFGGGDGGQTIVSKSFFSISNQEMPSPVKMDGGRVQH